MRNRYRDGRVFPYHLLFGTGNGTAIKALRESDVWHVHNYLVPQLVSIRDKQRVMAQFHSLPRLGNWRSLMRFAHKCYTVSQPLQEKEYKLPGLPNIIDPDEYRPARRSGRARIAFAPSTRVGVGNPASKGYDQVKATLSQVASKRDVEIVWIEGRPYEQNLKMKRNSHILIDDVVTGNWHRTTLEGMCFGCAVLGKIKKCPIVFSSLATLEERLLWLIDNPSVLRDYQERSRLFVLQEHHAMDQVKKYVKAYEEVANA